MNKFISKGIHKHSTPEITADGKVSLYENWKLTSGDKSAGTAILEELE